MPGIVVGVDGSTGSHQALERAVQEAADHDEPLTVITVHQAVRDVYGVVSHYPDDREQTEKARQAAQAETDQVLAAAAERPPSVKVTAVHGLPAEVLVKATRGASMIVLGSRGAGGFGRLTLGSVTTQVAFHAHCPVLIIRHGKS